MAGPILQTVQTHDFGSSPASEVVFTLPLGHTIAYLFTTGLTHLTGSPWEINVVLGNSDVFETGSTSYLWGAFIDQTAWVTATEQPWLCRLQAGLSGGPLNLQLFNMQTAAPVIAMGFGRWTGNGSGGTYTQGMRQAAISYRQIKVYHQGGTNITAGVLRCVSYKRINKVTTINTNGIRLPTLTGMTKSTSGICVMASLNETFATNKVTGRMVSGPGGTLVIDTAGAYLRNRVGTNFTDNVESQQYVGNIGARTVQNYFITGGCAAENLMRTQWWNWGNMGESQTTIQKIICGWMRTVEAHDVQSSSQEAASSTGGTHYWTEYEA